MVARHKLTNSRANHLKPQLSFFCVCRAVQQRDRPQQRRDRGEGHRPDRQDHQLLEDLVAHHELLASARDVSVVVQNSHAGVTCYLDLNSDVASQIGVNLCFLGGMYSGVESSYGIVKALVPDLINHL